MEEREDLTDQLEAALYVSSPWVGNSTNDSELYAAGMLIHCFKLPLTPLFLSVFTRISAVSASNTWRMERW